jgi:hypothetical protein
MRSIPLAKTEKELLKRRQDSRRETRDGFLRALGGWVVVENRCRIDKCWRGNAKWAESRKNLAGCAAGFGSKTTGGKAGDFYVVTSNADDAESPAPGTLRYGAVQKKPLWITFSKSMTIVLQSELFIASDKTLDGRGATVHIADGPCLTIQVCGLTNAIELTTRSELFVSVFFFLFSPPIERSFH